MPAEIPPLSEVRRITQKKRDAWWTVLLVDPVATPLVRLTAARTRITPNQITWGALLLGLGSAACFAMGDWRWLVAGAVVYHLSFILDCMDGKTARLTGTGSVFGAWLDYIFDRVRVMFCALALMAGQYHRTDDIRYVWLAAAVIFLDGLRYINSLEIFKTRHTMRKQLKSRIRAARRAENQVELTFMEDLLRENPEADVEQDLRTAQEETAGAQVGTLAAQTVTRTPAEGATEHAAHAPADPTAPTAPTEEGARVRRPVIDLHQEFRSRFPWYLRMRSFLLRHRIRTHLVSGIEFQMGVFIVGPLLDQVLAVTVVSGALLLVFELAIVYKLLLSTRDFTRTIDAFDRESATAGTPAPAVAQTSAAA
ncbi:CDP-alcohol phosphatidyltransferase family protein [Streptomyces sp. 891-h]|uniref:CDP-alcohol phosphatidyltransferase family protein n=1 Tax=Streptomyces sp. 891-h TaxID=2720714 RepID=UPI001FA99CAE|nr:CDP-alcohol phosphatidyltransferase family protein [Streptomyces sp. 891-h]UNZ19939.1 CDP-alcohol phosphatidyltransferase family protein [Streptomyces sp. 891-h]